MFFFFPQASSNPYLLPWGYIFNIKWKTMTILFAPGVFQQDKMLASGFHVNSQTLYLVSFYQKWLLFFLWVIFISLYILISISISSTFQNIEKNMMIVISLWEKPKSVILLLIHTIFMTASWVNNSLNIKSWAEMSSLMQGGDNWNCNLSQ